MEAIAITVKSKILALIFNKNKYISKIFNKIKLSAFQFTNLYPRKTAKIFINKFWQMNFYKLKYIKRCNNIYHD